METQQTQLAELWHLVVATPGRLSALLSSGSVNLERSVHTLIIDEADLMLSYVRLPPSLCLCLCLRLSVSERMPVSQGYEEDTRRVVGAVPRICQSMLMSATLSDDVQELQKLVLHNPAVRTLMPLCLCLCLCLSLCLSVSLSLCLSLLLPRPPFLQAGGGHKRC